MKDYISTVLGAIATAIAIASVVTLEYGSRALYPTTVSYTSTTPVAERIMWDGGGVVTEFIEHFSEIRANNALVVVDGQCISACTLVTALDPAKVCATPSAQFVFHSAFSRGPDGEKVFAAEITHIIWHQYPEKLRTLLTSKGWTGEERNDLLFIEGDDVLKFMRRCTDADMAVVKDLKPRINT